MSKRTSWAGGFVVTVTPFAENGAFDEKAMRLLIDQFINEGADGIVIAGSTGEWFAMSDDERGELFKVCADQNAGRTRLIAGTCSITTGSAVSLTRVAKDLGYDGALILPPPYVLPTPRETMAFFEAVNGVGLPLMLYNNPARTGVNLDAAFLDKLLRLETIVSLKESVKDLQQAGATLRAHGDELAVFCGLETYLLPMRTRGCVGSVAMSPNVLGKSGFEFTKLICAGRYAEALQLQLAIDRLYSAMYAGSTNPYVVLKEGMNMLGRHGGMPRLPLLPMAGEDRAVLSGLLGDLGLPVQRAHA